MKELKIIGKIDLTKIKSNDAGKTQLILKPKATKEAIKTEVIHFFAGRHGKVIGKLSNCMIAKIDYSFKGASIKDNEDWLCEITKEESNFVFVFPIELKVSAAENEANFTKQISSLQNKEWNYVSGKSRRPIAGQFEIRRTNK